MAAISQSHAAAASAARSKACHHTAAAVHAAAEDTAGAAAEEPMMEILDPVRSCNILPSAVVTRPCGPASCTSGGAASAANPAVPLSGAVYRPAAHTSSVAERAASPAAGVSVAPAPAASMVTSAEQFVSPAQKGQVKQVKQEEQMLCSTAELPTLAVVVSSAATSASGLVAGEAAVPLTCEQAPVVPTEALPDATDEVVLPTAADLPAALAVAAAGAAAVSEGLSAPRATEALPRAASPPVPTSRLPKKRKKSKYFSETFDGKKRRVNRIQKTKAENRAARAAGLAMPLEDNAESSSAPMSGDVANALTVSEDHCIGTELGIRDTLASIAHYHAFIT